PVLHEEHLWVVELRAHQCAVESSVQPFDAASDALTGAPLGVVDLPFDLVHLRPNPFGRCRRCLGVKVGGEIAELLIYRVPDGRNDGMRTTCDRSHDSLVAEREQIFERPAPAGNDDDIDIELAGARQRTDDLVWRA